MHTTPIDPVMKSIWRRARRARPVASLHLEDIVTRLCRGLIVLGRTHTVGPYTPAVPDPQGYTWCVMDQGGPVVLAFDAWEAACWFCRAERWPLEGYPVPLRLAQEDEDDRERRSELFERWRDRLDAWLIYRRMMAARSADRTRGG